MGHTVSIEYCEYWLNSDNRLSESSSVWHTDIAHETYYVSNTMFVVNLKRDINTL